MLTCFEVQIFYHHNTSIFITTKTTTLIFFTQRQSFHNAQENEPQGECINNIYVHYEHVADLTLWMNETLPLLNHSLLEMETLVETLSTSVLPSTQVALVSISVDR